jgi:tRNA pseudouridine38-40 synthase
MRNLRLDIAYDGTDFHGWQRQNRRLTIQGCLEAALERIVGTKVSLIGSGRTDAGVHALQQVANFKTECSISSESLQRALNSLLPATVRVTKAQQVDLSFHARRSARAKIYRYRILQTTVCPPFISRFVYHYPHLLDRRRMTQAAQCLEGKHDFTSFAAVARRAADEDGTGQSVPSPVRPAIRRVFRLRLLWRPQTSLLIYETKGDGFLHHMVRNIVGTLIEVGRGRMAPEKMPRILEARDRTQAGPTAPASGLCLVKVEY